MPAPQPGLIAVASWYRRQDYERIRQMMDDSDNFPETFEEWRKLADQQFAQALAQGIPVEKVIVDPNRFVEWCRQAEVDPDQQARIRYAAHVLQGDKPGHG